MTRRIEFIYFDLGNVLLSFDHQRASRQIGELVGASGEEVHRAVFDSGLQDRYESGEVDSTQFHDACAELFGPCQREPFLNAAADIFEPTAETHDLVEQLADSGRRLGILSNTCEAHWLFCWDRYEVLRRFDVYALSYELRSMKPDPAIYAAAAELAGVPAESIFFTDDREENVRAALEAGYDAVHFISASGLAGELAARGLLEG